VATWSVDLIWAHCSELRLRGCTILAPDINDQPACCATYRCADGINGVRFFGTRLSLEDSVVRAGNANLLNYTYPKNCFGALCPEGGLGGTAIAAPNALCVAVRTSISDGNGGSVAAGPWPRPPVAGLPVPSTFGTLLAYDLRHELGLPDAGGAGRPRGPTLRQGYRDAPLRLGEARIGQPMSISVMPSALEPLGVAFAMRLSPATWSTPFGTLHVPIEPAPPVLLTPTTGVQVISIPELPELIDQSLVGQFLALRDSFPFLSNPSVSHFARH
jgi:hypothetical protein